LRTRLNQKRRSNQPELKHMPYRFAIELSTLFNISLMCRGVFTYSGICNDISINH